MEASRYIIGIDLGTTNCAVYYIDTLDPSLAQHPFKILQMTSEGSLEEHQNLPSYCYLSAEREFSLGSLKMPWYRNDQRYSVGTFAKEFGAMVPSHMVSSAKSWLCNSAANRKEKILPLEHGKDIKPISPLQATEYYLRHIQDAWNYTMAKNRPEALFVEQEIVLTVPASFDEAARMLTVEAAKNAGYDNMTLLEEPQAAFYAWIARHEKIYESKFSYGDVILVCDIGGGTSDFSLVEVKESEGKLSFQRMAVGDHLLLGGDNIDLTIAHYIENKEGWKLTSKQWHQLVHQSRKVKEKILTDKNCNLARVVIQGEGSKLIGGTLTAELESTEVVALLCDGFFPLIEYSEGQNIKAGSAVRHMGLPYESDPAVTKHLATFLKCRPDFILFNGGTMKSDIFCDRVIKNIDRWFEGGEVKVLPSDSLDYAVARGAAYYGKVRRGLGVNIGSALPRNYYLEIDVAGTKRVLTILARGRQPGTRVVAKQEFFLAPNRPVSFQLWSSHTRLDDSEGDIIDLNMDDMHHLPPIYTALHYGKGSVSQIPVNLEVYYSEIGVLELSLLAQNSGHRWLLNFQLKTVSGQDNTMIDFSKSSDKDEIIDETLVKDLQLILKKIFTSHPSRVIKALEAALERDRQDWSLSILRSLWPALMGLSKVRKNSPDHEARWWNLAGYFLRPGYGYACDDFRVKELWRYILEPLAFPNNHEVEIQRWVCLRRVSGGLGRGQQSQMASKIVADIFDKKKKHIVLQSKVERKSYNEKIRALGALELVDVKLKEKVGEALIERITSEDSAKSDLWSLGRIGGRHLLYGSVANVVVADTVQSWIKKLVKVDSKEVDLLMLQLARETGHRETALSSDTINLVEEYFLNHGRHDFIKLLHDTNLSQQEEEELFGDQLPQGLTLKIS